MRERASLPTVQLVTDMLKILHNTSSEQMPKAVSLAEELLARKEDRSTIVCILGAVKDPELVNAARQVFTRAEIKNASKKPRFPIKPFKPF